MENWGAWSSSPSWHNFILKTGMLRFSGAKNCLQLSCKRYPVFSDFLCYRVWCTAARNGLHWCAARSNELCKHKCAQEAMHCQKQRSDALVRTLFIAQMHLHSAQHQSKLHKCIFCKLCKYNNARKEALHLQAQHGTSAHCQHCYHSAFAHLSFKSVPCMTYGRNGFADIH